MPEIHEQGGVHLVTDDMLQKLGIVIGGARKKILEAIKQKCKGGKKLRFGKVERYEPTLTKRPYPKCVWVEVREWEDREGWRAARPALSTWRFFTTGTDGLDDFYRLKDAFQGWKDAMPKGWFTIIQEWFVGLGELGAFATMPCCGRSWE